MNNSLTIREYALYLGAPCRVSDEDNSGYFSGRVEGVSGFNSTLYPEIHVDGDTFHADCVTLILRHMDSLTEAEARELYLLTEGIKWEFIVVGVDQPCLYCWWKWYDDRPNSRLIGNPIVWRWLLAHYFDLFGWIEAGLALDASKVKTIV